MVVSEIFTQVEYFTNSQATCFNYGRLLPKLFPVRFHRDGAGYARYQSSLAGRKV